jgi:hypothetical protein
LTLKLEIALRPHASDDEAAGDDSGSLDFTEEDLRVLRSMKIKIDPAD